MPDTRDFSPTCPQCGEHLALQWDAIEPRPMDRMSCPDHGDVGNLREIGFGILQWEDGRFAGEAFERYRKRLSEGYWR